LEDHISLYTIARKLTGLIPETPLALAQDAVSEALGAIYDQLDWAFQKGFAGWLAPGVIFNTGSTTTTPYSPVVIGDATTSQLINNYTGQPFITQLQYRNPGYAIYDIIATGTNPTVAYATVLTPGSGQTPGIYTVAVLDTGAGTGATVSIIVNANGTVTIPPVVLTQGSNYSAPYVTFAHGGTPASFSVFLNATLILDRPWMEPTSGPGQPYMIYQVYFVAPVQDFRKFVAIQDMTNDQDIDFWSMTQAALAVEDPQRQNFSIPRFCVPAGVDQRAGSSTLGWQRFELWPQQGNYTPYTLSYRRRGPIPQQPTDFLSMTSPYPITEEMVTWRSREVLCQYKEAQKDRTTPRGAGANWTLLSQMAQKEYAFLLGQAISIDLNLDGESVTFTSKRPRWPGGEPYATMNGRINIGGYN
jgi:hypothetical protein